MTRFICYATSSTLVVFHSFIYFFPSLRNESFLSICVVAAAAKAIQLGSPIYEAMASHRLCSDHGTLCIRRAAKSCYNVGDGRGWRRLLQKNLVDDPRSPLTILSNPWRTIHTVTISSNLLGCSKSITLSLLGIEFFCEAAYTDTQ